MTPLARKFPVAAAFVFAIWAFVLGAAAAGCGPKQKFCPQTSNGVCPEPMDASGESIHVMADAPEEERGSVYVPADAATQ